MEQLRKNKIAYCLAAATYLIISMKEAADKMSTVDQEHPEVLNSYPQEGTSVITSRFTSIARREYISTGRTSTYANCIFC